MSCNDYEEIKKNLELSKKLKRLGICSNVVGPTGPIGPTGPTGSPGETGPTGPVSVASYEGMLHANYLDTTDEKDMQLNNSWLIPNPSPYFNLKGDTEIEIEPGIYEITLSSFITGIDSTHGVEIYLKDDQGSAIKDLDFKLDQDSVKEMNFSRPILFRFENKTTLSISTFIIGDIGTSNIKITNTSLLLKKIHE